MKRPPADPLCRSCRPHPAHDPHWEGSAHEAADRLRRLAAILPHPAGPAVAWLQRPGAKWVRIPAGGLLIVGGLLSFLPVFGLWMVPLGALLLAHDVPAVRRPTLKALRAAEAWWARRASRSRRAPADQSVIAAGGIARRRWRPGARA